MLRVLFAILSVVVAILAVVMDQLALYLAAGALLLLVVILSVVSRVRKHRREKEAYASAGSKDDELKSLGIMEIRPRGSGAPIEAPPAEAAPAGDVPSETYAPPARVRTPEGDGRGAGTPDAPEPAEAPASGPPRVDPPAPSPSRPEPPRGDADERPTAVRMPVHAAEEPLRAVVVPLLQALCAAADAHTVCLLRQGGGGLRYQIEGIVSRSAYARKGGSFSAKTPLLTEEMAEEPVIVGRVADDDIPAASLGYYREAIAVREVAMAPVPLRSETALHFLLVDATQEDTFGRRHHQILHQFARLLATVLDAEEGLEDDDADEAAEEPVVRPRREIIAEEMEMARAMNHPLALALVYLNEAENVAQRGASAVVEAETLLLARLRRATPKGRVERFGELTYGVFYEAPVQQVETWAADMQHQLDESDGPLRGGVSVGVAMMQPRHEGPEQLRADATAALHEAYESGQCTILE